MICGIRSDRTLPPTCGETRRQDSHSVPSRVVNQRRDRIETHRLRIQQSKQELRRIVRLQPGGGKRDQREAPRVRLGETVVREADEILTDLVGDFRRHVLDVAARRPREHRRAEIVQREHQLFLLADVAHRPPQRVGLAAAVAAEGHADRHRLLLKNRNALRPFQNRLERGMRIRHRLQPQSPLGIRVDELRLNRARSDQRHLHDDVVQTIRLGVMDRRDLRARFDLERPDRLCLGDQIVGRLVVRRQRVHLRARAGADLDRIEGPADHRQSTEAEEIELRHVDEVEIVLVELEDRPPHRRLLDGKVIPERRRRQNESSNVR